MVYLDCRKLCGRLVINILRRFLSQLTWLVKRISITSLCIFNLDQALVIFKHGGKWSFVNCNLQGQLRIPVCPTSSNTFQLRVSSQGHAGWWQPLLSTGEIWWAWFDFGVWFSCMQIFSWTMNYGPEEGSPAKRVKGKRRQMLFWPLTLKLLTPVLLLFQQRIKAGNFKVSVKQEDTAFQGRG